MSSVLQQSFFFADTAPTAIYTLSLHDALPICLPEVFNRFEMLPDRVRLCARHGHIAGGRWVLLVRSLFGFGLRLRRRTRSEEHTSELQSQFHLVCRLLLEKKKSIIGSTELNAT